MREHKYRVWSKELQKMVYFTLGQLLHSYNDEGDYPSIDGTDLFSIHQDINPDEAMQFTGLKDKTGKDIYKDDIVIMIWGKTWKGEDRVHGPVVVKYGVHMVGAEGDCTHTGPALGFYFDGIGDICNWNSPIEIIGNIRENPDLIEVK